MTKEEILSLIENEKIEFKKAKNQLPLSFFETYSAFAYTTSFRKSYI